MKITLLTTFGTTPWVALMTSRVEVLPIKVKVSLFVAFGISKDTLSLGAYLEQQQNMLKSLNTLMIALVFAATVITLIAAYQERKNKLSCYSLIVSAICLFCCILISRFGNSPFQKEMLMWKIENIPSNWTLLRDQWWKYHVLRTIAELIALVLISWVHIKDYNTTTDRG
jgi:hypothetical protein